MSGPKILYVIGSLDVGGAERHIFLVAPKLKKLGWDIEIFCLTKRGAQADDIEKAGVKIVAPLLPIDGRQTALGKALRLWASAMKLFFYLLFRRPQIVHFFLTAAYLIGGAAAVLAFTPIRVMSRRSLNHYQQKHRLLARLEVLLHGKMHILLGNSHAVVQQLRQEAPDYVPIELIYNGMEIDNFRRRDEVSRQHAPTELTLVIVANLIPYKGHADLFHALGTISDRLPDGWKLLCAGRDDGIGASLLELARNLSIDKNVELIGQRTDVPALLANADIGLLCSHEEGFSNAILEYMMAGLPTVATDVGGNAEAVIDGKTGFVVPSRNVDALGEAILRLATNPGLREQMGAAARQRVETEFSLDRCVANYHDLYGRLLSKHIGHSA